MANPYHGEVDIVIGGRQYSARLTLGALAELECLTQENSLMDLINRFDSQAIKSIDVLNVIYVALKPAGWSGSIQDLQNEPFEGGVRAVAIVAAKLLKLAFSLP